MNQPANNRSFWLVAMFIGIIPMLYCQPNFINPLPIPPLIDANADVIELEMRAATHKFNPAIPSDSLNGGPSQPDGITTFCYNQAGDSTMTLLGPTLLWHTGGNAHIRVTNLLPQPTTTHWHGAEVASMFDGGPHQHIMINETWDIDFPVLDYAGTLWYHPHYHNATVQQVQMGLSGMIIVEDSDDPLQNVLPHTYGVDDIPVIIGDMGLQTRPNLNAPFILDTLKGKRPFNLVNGVNSPYVEVPAHVIRFRILNGSTRKGIKFGFSETYSGPTLLNFNLIGTDGGYTITPQVMSNLMNGPGARDQVVIDLGGYAPGDVVYLRNLKSSLPAYVVGSPLAAPNGGGKDSTSGEAFLQLRIVADSNFPGYTPITSFTPFVTTWEPGLQDTSNISRRRHKKLVFTAGTGGGPNMFTIDGTSFDEEILNDTVCVNTKEIWTIENTTTVAHPFHIHKIQFRILDIDSMGTMIDLATRGLNGPKDDVLVLPNWKLRFMGSFDDYPSPIEAHNGYMYHCHILPHEDAIGGGMMHQFVVTDESPCLGSGLNEIDNGVAMRLYPNPSSGELFLQGVSMKPSTLRFMDLTGKILKEQAIPAFEGNVEINTDGVPKGMLLVEWQTTEGTVSRKWALW